MLLDDLNRESSSHEFEARFVIDLLDYYPDSNLFGGYIRLAGWVYCINSSNKETIAPEIEIGTSGCESGHRSIRLTCNVNRPDVVEVYPEAPVFCGFDFVIPVCATPDKISISLWIEHHMVHALEKEFDVGFQQQCGKTHPILDRNPVINVRFYTDYPVCNYTCPYCVAGHGNSIATESAWDAAMFNRFDNIIDNLTKLPLKLNVRPGVGGEFFLSDRLMDGARKLAGSENVHAVNLITNLSLPLKRYQEFLSGLDLSKIALVASYHPTEIKDKEKWLETATWMNDHLDFAVILVGYPPLMHQIGEIKSQLNNLGIEVFLQGFIGSHEGRLYPRAYTPEQKKILRQLSYSRHDYEFFIEARKPGFCYSGFNSFYLDMSGIVSACGVGGWPWPIMGNLALKAAVNLLPGPHPCVSKTCLCDTEYINTTIFFEHYQFTGLNQHKYVYRYKELEKIFPQIDEWEIDY